MINSLYSYLQWKLESSHESIVILKMKPIESKGSLIAEQCCRGVIYEVPAWKLKGKKRKIIRRTLEIKSLPSDASFGHCSSCNYTVLWITSLSGILPQLPGTWIMEVLKETQLSSYLWGKLMIHILISPVVKRLLEISDRYCVLLAISYFHPFSCSNSALSQSGFRK